MSLSALLLGCISHAAVCQDFPVKPVRWIIPYSAGASNDVVARLLAQKLSQKWGQPIVIENRAGAGGTIGASLVAHAAPDGYTLLMTNPGSNAIQYVLNQHSTYSNRDFSHVILLGSAPLMLSTRQDFAASTVAELIALAKASPGVLTGGSSGSGGSSHFALELFNRAASVEIRHIPYKGAAPAVADVVGGQISLIFTTPASIFALLEANKLKVLGVSSQTRLTAFPSIPTMAEQGVRDFNDNIWFGMSVPAATPHSIISKLNFDFNDILQRTDTTERFTSLGLEIAGGSSEHFSNLINADIERLSQLVKAANIRTSH
ncbi:MAG: tripartite tricarboxylate transporter substrate binding protein [Alcaligenaceae bacterium]